MPTSALHPCPQVGCPHLVGTGSPCPDHNQRTRLSTGIPFAQTQATAAQRGYGARWQRRSTAFKRRHPFCGMRPNGQRPVMSKCFDEGKTTLVLGQDERGIGRGQVDHVIPHRGNQKLFWDELGNWQSLCRTCGSRKSGAGL